MNYFNRFVFILLVAASIPVVPSVTLAQNETGGIMTTPWDEPDDRSLSDDKKKKAPRPIDPYVKRIAERFNKNLSELNKLWNRGYGRNELIKIMLISSQAHKELKDVVRQRDKGEKLSAIAEKYKLDYRALVHDAQSIRGELDYAVASSTETTSSPVKYRTEISSSVTQGTTVYTTETSSSTEKTHE